MTDTSKDIKEETKDCGCETKEVETPKVEQTPKVETPQVEQPKTEQAPSWFTSAFEQIKADYTNLRGELEKIKTLETQIGIREKPKSVTTISNSDSEPFSPKKAVEKMVKWLEGGRETDCTITIPEDYLRSLAVAQVKTPTGIQERFINGYTSNARIAEAVTYTGTHSVFGADTDVGLEPGSVSRVPVRQFAKQKVLGKGEHQARFFKHDLPATSSQTVGTKATVATMDIESIEINPSTITGVHFEVGTDKIEDNPYDTLGIVLNASAFRYEDFIATDMLDTVSAEGTLTPGKWIRADTGATITHSDTASIAFDPTGIATGVEYLEEKGYLYGGVRPVAFLHHQQFKELIEDTELTNYIAFSEPNAYRKNILPELYGCQIVVTNTVQEKDNTTTDAYNAIMCVPQHSYGVAYKRDLNIKLHDIPEENEIWTTVNWRVKTGVIDATSIVRMTSAKA